MVFPPDPLPPPRHRSGRRRRQPPPQGRAALTTFASRIVTARTTRQLSIAVVATGLGVEPQTLARWEAGRTRPSRHKLRRLATLLDVPFAELAALAGYSIDAG